MGKKGGGGTLCPIISFILEQSAYSKRVSWSLSCQETHSREIYFVRFFKNIFIRALYCNW